MTDNVMTIGELARGTDTKVETVRFYEKSGLLPAPARTPGNYRAYSADHLRRLSFIRRARDLGFSLYQARALPCLAVERDQQWLRVGGARWDGVSPATVSRALKTPTLREAATLERVRSAARKLHYQPLGVARSLRRRRSMVIGKIIQSMENATYISGMVEYTKRQLAQHA